MEVVAQFIEYLLDHGRILAAVIVAAGALMMSWGFRRWRARGRDRQAAQQATTGPASQVTQVADVRSKGDVNVSPKQRHG
jgi:hypothetical protein